MSRRACIWGIVALLATAVSTPALPAEPEDVRAQVYEIRHRPPADAAELVSTILSEDGEIALSPRLRRIVVTDRPAVLQRVVSLLESFDVPPRNVEVNASLFLGTDRREEEAGRRSTLGEVSREIRGITETIGDFTKWNAFESLGARSVTATEGSTVTADLAEGYRVVLELESVDASVVKFKSVSLQRVFRTAEGEDRFQELYTAAIVLPSGRRVQVGVAQNPESKQALFLSLKAGPR